MTDTAAAGFALIQAIVSNQVCTTAWTWSGWAATKSDLNDRVSGMAPGKSLEVAIALLPARPSAVVVNGAKTPTASTCPATNAAAAASVSSGVNVTSCSVRPARFDVGGRRGCARVA